MKQLKEIEKIRMGALLHDVGKFAFRTHQKINHELFAEIINQQYIKAEYANELIGLFNPEDTGKEYHIRRIIEISDWLAAAERVKLTDDEINEENKTKSRDVIKKPLKTIFSEIELSEKGKNEFCEMHYLPKKLELNSLFPLELKTDDVVDHYRNKNLWQNFTEEIKSLNCHDEEYFNALFFIFKKYLLLIPSAAYVDKADISLFDHIKTTVAIAESLFMEDIDFEVIRKNISLHFRKNEKKQDVEYDEEILKKEAMILVHGDLSGIQNFIYTIHTKAALKSLKGRSSFLSILNEGLAYHFVNELNHTSANILFQGGGHFYILTAKKNEEKIKEITKEINKNLLSEFGSSLFLSVGTSRLSYIDLLEDGISNKWAQVGQKSNEKKRKKFYDFFSEEFFQPKEIDITKNIPCSICNKDVTFEKEKLYSIVDGIWGDYIETSAGTNRERFCKFCKDMVEFKNLFTKKTWNTNELSKYYPYLNLKDFQFNNYLNTTENIPFKFFATQLPLENGSILTMDELSKMSKGTEKIGFLKMDVDNLGKIFVDGIKTKKVEDADRVILYKKSISKLSHLSTMISLFFEGYINQILKKYENKIYLVYSGGDDTFALGSWDAIIEFSHEVYNEFRRYTACNPDITLSAGIAITSSHFPVSKGANLAENALEKAKKYSNDPLKKNKICIMDSVFNWDYTGESDFDKMLKLKSELVSLVIDKNISRSILQRTQNSIKGMKKVFVDIENGKFDVPSIWRLKYYIIRKYSPKRNPELFSFVSFVDEMVKNKLDGQEVNLDIIGTAARIAELETRHKED